MKPGIRLQLGALLAGLFVLAFAPLYVAVAELATARFSVEHRVEAEATMRALSAVSAPQAAMGAYVGSSRAVGAIGRYRPDGRRIFGEGALALPEALDAEARSAGALVVVRDGEGAWVAALRPNPGVARPFGRLVGLYTVLLAFALLVLTYLALTRLVVAPLDRLAEGARRVTEGSRALALPPRGAKELVELGRSLAEMTEKLRAEEEALRAKIAELERVTEELRASQAVLVRSERLASVGRLAAGLAHEVGNPLAAVLGLEELLLSGGLDEEEQRDFLTRLHRETERIHRIVRDLLDFARGGTAPPSGGGDERGEIAFAVGEVTALLAPQRVMREVELALDLEEGLPAVRLSNEHLTQVLLNLVSNAAEASGEGGHVRVMGRLVGAQIEVVVEDDGPGIDEKVQETLFEPFVTTKEVGHGTGLGLAVVRGLVEGAGGTIVAGAREDGARGARFVVRLPVVG